MSFYTTNGKSIKSLTIDDVFGAGFEASLVGQADVSPRFYYAVVAFIHRAVNLRANAVAGVPVTLQRGKRDISARPEFAGLMDNLSPLIWRTELALCLSQYGAYWRRSTNKSGLNPTPEWLLPHACWPYITAQSGLETIRYIHPWGVAAAGHVEMLPPDDLVIFWLPSLDRVNWPGPPPGFAALAAAAALANRDTFVSNYFSRGAIKGTLLSVPTNTNPEEKKKLKTWWDQLFAGVRNAWRSIVVSSDVKPIIIGEGLAEIESEKLTQQYREDVAAAFGEPVSMLLSNAANYATAREERISFYEETVFPELDLILTAINKQWLLPQYDAELIAHPEQTEARQDAQVQQAQAITELVGQPVLTVDEGRAWLGMEPMPKEEEPEQPAPDENADYQAMEEEANADDIAEQDAEHVPAGSSGDPERIKEAGAIKDDEREKAPSKALRHADGRYRVLPGSGMRALERGALLAAHAEMRQATRDRHQAERQQARERQIGERGSAKDAGTRLRLVHRHRAELMTLAQKHAAERAMLRSLHAGERSRLSERHAASRAGEQQDYAVIRSNGHSREQVPA